jgi:tetratricopeptide (TPR) repeat protein
MDPIFGGMIRVTELSPDVAAAAMIDMRFDAGTEAAANFFLRLFPNCVDIIDDAAVRLHQEGNKKKAYSILEQGLKHSDDKDRLRLELAAFLDMDNDPQHGLQIIRDVHPDTQRYHVIKGNLFRKADQWDESAVCWHKAIKSDPFDIFPWFNLGYYFLTVKKLFENAENHFQNACNIFPEKDGLEHI